MARADDSTARFWSYHVFGEMLIVVVLLALCGLVGRRAFAEMRRRRLRRQRILLDGERGGGVGVASAGDVMGSGSDQSDRRLLL